MVAMLAQCDEYHGAMSRDEAASLLTKYVRSTPPLATENLLESTDGVLRPPPLISFLSGRHPAAFYSMLTAGGSSDDVIAL